MSIKRLLSVLLVFVLMVLAGTQSYANVEQASEFNVLVVSDSSKLYAVDLQKEGGVNYKIQISKTGTGYSWLSQVTHNGILHRETRLEITKLSSDFSAERLATALEQVKSNPDSLSRFYDNNIEFQKQSVIVDSGIQPEFVPAIPIAIAGLTGSAVLLLEAVMVVSLTIYVYSEVSETLKQKKATSDVTNTVIESSTYVGAWDHFIGSAITTHTSATKHMQGVIVTDLHNRLKNYGNENNTRIYTSSRYPNNIMVVIDIVSDMGGQVNRHLGNFLNGSTILDPNIGNEWLNLKGYSIFLVYDRNAKRIYHAHFTPTRLRDVEIEYNRYLKSYDLQIYPSYSENEKYDHEASGWAAARDSARNNRGLLLDSSSRRSVVPYK